MKISKDTIKTIINYGHVASDDMTRPFLETIKLEVTKENQLKVTACDGVIFAESIHALTNDDDSLLGQYMLFPKKDLKLLTELLKDCKGADIFNLDLDFTHQVITFYSDHYPQVIKSSAVNRDYPRMDRIKPSKFEKRGHIAFNPDNIISLNKAVYGARKIREFKSFNFNFGKSQNAPMKCEVSHQGINHYLLLMPVRTSNMEKVA